MLTKLKSSLLGLRRFLTAKRRYKHRLEKVIPAEGKFGRIEWVLSRALCRFVRLDLKSVPKVQRARALDLQVSQWSPFADTGTYVLWEQDSALVWAWDAARVGSAMVAYGLKSVGLAVIPETLLNARHQEGVKLISGLDGFEGQIWQDGGLLGSRWWPAVPDAVEWINFQRDAGASPESRVSDVPPPLLSDWEGRPWGKSVSLFQAGSESGRYEHQAIYAIALCLLAPSLWYGMQLLKLHEAFDVNMAELRTLMVRAEPIQVARGQALDALNWVTALQSFNPYPDQISLMGKVAEILPKDGAYLKEWEFINGKLKVIISSSNKLVSSEYVKLFQAAGPFKNVQVLPGNDPVSLALNMEVTAYAEVEFGGRDHDSVKKDGGPASQQSIKPL